jgi:hypothetical protein
MKKFYRPIGNKFLDQCSPFAFWASEQGLKEDFPDDTEIKSYTEDELFTYCKNNDLNETQIEVYR